jgi:hypothetical protein
MPKPPEKPAGPVVLSANCIADGRFIPAGSETPFTEETLPPHLREYLARGDEDFFTHASRNIYNQQPGPEPGPVFYQATGGAQFVRRQASRAARGMEEQVMAEEWANEPLPVETQEALADIHDRASALAKAQIQFNRDQADIAYEQAEAEAAAKEARQQLYVRRGGEFGRVERARLKPGEPVFVKRENGEMEAVGIIDSRGEPPEPEIYT